VRHAHATFGAISPGNPAKSRSHFPTNFALAFLESFVGDQGIFTKGENWVHRACSPEAIVEEFLSAEKYPELFETPKSAKA
jgi:hypothetical protein